MLKSVLKCRDIRLLIDRDEFSTMHVLLLQPHHRVTKKTQKMFKLFRFFFQSFRFQLKLFVSKEKLRVFKADEMQFHRLKNTRAALICTGSMRISYVQSQFHKTLEKKCVFFVFWFNDHKIEKDATLLPLLHFLNFTYMWWGEGK